MSASRLSSSISRMRAPAAPRLASVAAFGRALDIGDRPGSAALRALLALLARAPLATLAALLGTLRELHALLGRKHLGRIRKRGRHALGDGILQRHLLAPQRFDRGAVDAGRLQQVHALLAQLPSLLAQLRDLLGRGPRYLADLDLLLGRAVHRPYQAIRHAVDALAHALRAEAAATHLAVAVVVVVVPGAVAWPPFLRHEAAGAAKQAGTEARACRLRGQRRCTQGGGGHRRRDDRPADSLCHAHHQSP